MFTVKKADPNLIPEVNIGLLGHVDHGKTTLTEALTGKWTDTHSEELKRGITIRLGYADVTFYRCPKCKVYTTVAKCKKCFVNCKPIRTVSFVDSPGHESLMATVLTGSSLIDGALLLIAANEKCPMPQTREHLTTLEVVGIKNIVIIQNKIDLVDEKRVKESYKEIKKFVKGTIAEKAPIIPISAQQRINIEYIIEAIEEHIPTPKRDKKKDPLMLIARSFDVNKPGAKISKLVGGVFGGSIIQGELKTGSKFELRPGVKIGDKWKPIITKIVSLEKARQKMKEAGPGGLLGVMTELDPALTKADGLVGNVLGLPEKLPKTSHSLKIKTKLLERVVGTKEMGKVEGIKPNEALMINVGTARTIGVVKNIRGPTIDLDLRIPVCVNETDRVVLSRQILGRWRLIGYGNVVS